MKECTLIKMDEQYCIKHDPYRTNGKIYTVLGPNCRIRPDVETIQEALVLLYQEKLNITIK